MKCFEVELVVACHIVGERVRCIVADEQSSTQELGFSSYPHLSCREYIKYICDSWYGSYSALQVRQASLVL